MPAVGDGNGSRIAGVVVAGVVTRLAACWIQVCPTFTCGNIEPYAPVPPMAAVVGKGLAIYVPLGFESRPVVAGLSSGLIGRGLGGLNGLGPGIWLLLLWW